MMPGGYLRCGTIRLRLIMRFWLPLFFFLGPLSLAAAFPAHVSTSFETKEVFVLRLCNRRIPKLFFIFFLFHLRGKDLAAAPGGTLNKQESAAAQSEVAAANCRLLLCGAATLLGVSGVLP